MTHSSKRELTLRNSKGFTLIELLVVIAIIGILASIVLASLSSARAKGADGTMKADLQSLRSQAEIFNSTGYSGFCTHASTTPILNAAAVATGLTSSDVVTALATAGAAAKVTCHDSATGYAVEAPLKSDATQFWCVDYTGAAQQKTTHIAASSVSCP